MKLNVVVAAAMLLSSFAVQSVSAAGLPDTPENRVAEAKRYLTVAPMKDMMGKMVAEMSKELPAEEQAMFQRYMSEFVRIEVLEKASVDAMAKHLTAGEIKAITDFYATPEGRSVMDKMPAYMGDVMPAIMQETQRAAQQMIEKLQQEQAQKQKQK